MKGLCFFLTLKEIIVKSVKQKDLGAPFYFFMTESLTIQCELVGIKNLKSTGNWRLEFDVYELDTSKIKNLITEINKSFHMALIKDE